VALGYRRPVSQWQPDVLGQGFQALTLDLQDDDEGPVVATLVRYQPPTSQPVRSVRVVLYLHGWSDYFFQTELARFWAGQGAAFYALDLRKYGRSLREHQTPTYIDNLAVYDEDLAAALAVVSSVTALLRTESGVLVATYLGITPARIRRARGWGAVRRISSASVAKSNHIAVTVPAPEGTEPATGRHRACPESRKQPCHWAGARLAQLMAGSRTGSGCPVRRALRSCPGGRAPVTDRQIGRPAVTPRYQLLVSQKIFEMSSILASSWSAVATSSCPLVPDAPASLVASLNSWCSCGYFSKCGGLK